MEELLSDILSRFSSPSAVALLYGLTAALAYLECAAFVGLLMPGESFVSFAGFLASRGLLDLGALFPIVIAAAFLGDVTGYLMGRWLGGPFLETTHRFLRVPRPLIDSARDFFRRHGGKTVLVARFVGFLRALAPFMAGASRTRLMEFLLYDFLGAGAWATAFLLLGYFLGEGYRAVERYAGRGGLILALAVIGIWAALALVRRYRVSLSGLRFIFRKEVIFTAWFLTGAALLVALAEDVTENETLAFDRQALLRIHDFANPFLDRLMLFLTQFGSLAFIVALLVFSGLVLLAKGRRLAAGLYAGATVTGIFLGSALKLGMHRPRPELWAVPFKVPSYSFPSGHAVAASMVFWFLAWIVFRQMDGRLRLPLSALLGLVPFLVGFTRLYLGAHWPTDVLGGYALSFAVLAPWLYLYELAGP